MALAPASFSRVGLAALLFTALPCLVACAPAARSGEADEAASALTSDVAPNSSAVTTASVRLRSGPSQSAPVLRMLSAGTSLTLLEGTLEAGYVHASLDDGDTGYVWAGYVALQSGASPGGGEEAPAVPTGETFTAQATAYYPASSAMEGGFVDRRGAPLRTLQAYLAGAADYVSVAMDSNAFPYGQKIRIAELEAKYGQVIDLRVVDTGGAFRGRGRSRIDICVANRQASFDAAVNGPVTITVVE